LAPPAFRLVTADARNMSDSHGRFRLSGLQPGSSYRIEARKQGFAPLLLTTPRLPPTAPAGAIVDLGRLVLLPAVLSEGRVMDSTGLAGWVLDRENMPVQGAIVALRPEEAPAGVVEPRLNRAAELRATVEPSGRFQLESVAPGRYELSATAKGFQSPPVVRLEIVAGAPPEEVRIVLERGAVVSGQVLNGDGEPASGARVILGQAETSADESGIYRLQQALARSKPDTEPSGGFPAW
jgi:hypothetical protein